MKALIKVGYRCNHLCVFCHAHARRGEEAPSSEVEARIDRAAALGHTMVVLSGGEPTLRPELLGWAARIAGRGLDLGLVTNGSMLDAHLVGELLRHRLGYVHLSLHGGTAALHDAAVGAPAFDKVRRALAALGGRGLDLWVNCVVTTLNLDHLDGVVDLVRAVPGAALKFTLVEPKGAAGDHFDALVPRIAAAAPRVLAALRRASAGEAPLKVAHDALPLCWLEGFERARGDLRAHGFATMAEVGEPDLFAVDETATVKPPRCEGCALRGRCPGLFRGYYARFGDAELRPVLGQPRSNSFNYTYQARVPPPPSGEPCPVRALGVTPWDRGRHLFVQHQGRVGRFRADTADFCDEDVARVKHDQAQLYLDASQQEAVDDFARQLVKLRRAALCDGCPDHAACTGLYEPVWDNVFARDEARVRELLAALEGEVLDIGCGEGPYGDAIAQRAAAGAMHYTGVEPDAGRAERMAKLWPWARVVCSTAEALEPAPGSFDHVLVLRSWNHLHEPIAVAQRLTAALRPGGTLLVVDNEPFGLARTARQAARAERSTARFEHYRNDGAAEALRLLRGAGVLERLELVERLDVGPATSDQWLLRFTKLG